MACSAVQSPFLVAPRTRAFVTHHSPRLPFVAASAFLGSQVATTTIYEAHRKSVAAVGKVNATAVVETTVEYTLPTWADFEIGKYAVFWETATGKLPASGEQLTIFYNPTARNLVPNPNFGVAFNGGFNQPIMCGGEPRVMTRKDRGSNCTPFYTIKINVPLHALTLEFSFTDGESWDGTYKIKFQIPDKWKNMPAEFFNKGLAEDLSRNGACEKAIYPDATFVQDRCLFPASLIHEGGKKCELDIVPGCTNPESPFYNPLANEDDGSCPLIPNDSS